MPLIFTVIAQVVTSAFFCRYLIEGKMCRVESNGLKFVC